MNRQTEQNEQKRTEQSMLCELNAQQHVIDELLAAMQDSDELRLADAIEAAHNRNH